MTGFEQKKLHTNTHCTWKTNYLGFKGHGSPVVKVQN